MPFPTDCKNLDEVKTRYPCLLERCVGIEGVCRMKRIDKSRVLLAISRKELDFRYVPDFDRWYFLPEDVKAWRLNAWRSVKGESVSGQSISR